MHLLRPSMHCINTYYLEITRFFIFFYFITFSVYEPFQAGVTLEKLLKKETFKNVNSIHSTKNYTRAGAEETTQLHGRSISISISRREKRNSSQRFVRTSFRSHLHKWFLHYRGSKFFILSLTPHQLFPCKYRIRFSLSHLIPKT